MPSGVSLSTCLGAEKTQQAPACLEDTLPVGSKGVRLDDKDFILHLTHSRHGWSHRQDGCNLFDFCRLSNLPFINFSSINKL